MNAMRESMIRARPRRRRPIWGIAATVAASVLVVLALVVAILWLAGRSGQSAEPAVSATPLPCSTTYVTAAQELPRANKVVVNVFNSTKRKGLAAITAKELQSLGFVVKKIENDPEGAVISGVGEIRYGPKGEAAARRLSYYLPGAELMPIDRGNKRVDVALGKKFEGLVDDAAAVAAMASPSPSLSGPGCVTPTPGGTPTGSPTGTPAMATPTPSVS